MGSIGELVRIIPHQVGFVPSESLVVQCLEDDLATRVMRIDLPDVDEPWQHEFALIQRCAHLSGQLDPERDSCLVVVYSHDQAAVELARRVAAFFRRSQCRVLATVVVDRHEILTLSADGMVADREPIDAPDTPALTALKAVNTLNGRHTLTDRDELTASVAPPEGLGEAVGRRAVASAVQDLEHRIARGGRDQLIRDRLLDALLGDALSEIGCEGAVRVGTAARLAVHCHRPPDRDALLTRMLGRRRQPWTAVLISALRRIPAGDSEDLCAVLAVIAYRAGDGALAQVAADRVLATDPSHRLTLLMLDIMFAGLPPTSLDGMLEGSP